MNKVTLELLDKEKLTDDVFDLKFKVSSDVEVTPWQFCTFVLKSETGKKMRRAYSIANKVENVLSFIIKRLENWTGWSKKICDVEIWDTIDWIYPLWTFVLQNEDKPKLFIWTGTGFAPLYFQILESLKRWDKQKIMFVFWVRNLSDVFYKEVLDQIRESYPNFEYSIFLSRDEKDWFQNWYVTDYLNIENTLDFEEFYICWSPAMVIDAKDRLTKIWKSNIFSEEY